MSTVSHDSPMQLTIMGPRWTDAKALWRCVVRVLHQHVEVNGGTVPRRATRPIFVPRPNTPHFPTTIVARCHIQQVFVRFGDDEVFSNGDFETTFLLGSDVSDWFTDVGGDGHLRRAFCLAGEFPLKPFFSDASAPRPIRNMLGDVIDDPTKIDDLRATAGGLSFAGRTKMPAGGVLDKSAPYLVEVELPPPVPDAQLNLPTNLRGSVLVRLDRERLDRFSEGRTALKTYFANLVSRLNPSEAVSKKSLLRWSRLDLADPTRIPEYHWRATQNQATEFEFGQGMWRLTLSDQAAGMSGIIPRGALIAGPQVTIRASGQQFEVSVKPVRDGDSLWDSFTTLRPEAEYLANLDQQNNWSESVTLRRIELGYDAVEVARRLRAQYGLKSPRTDDFESPTSADLLAGTAPAAQFSDGNIDPPVLWGFTPLTDGWAQLPFLNMTEQLFVEGLPDPATPPTPDRRVALFRGAALFGNDGDAPLRRAGHIPWNVVLNDARNYAGTWTLGPGGLESISLRLDDPVVSAEGLLWLATDPPTGFDALPDQDNWLASLEQVPLRTPRARPLRDGRLDENGCPVFESTDPYPSPFLLKDVKISIDRKIESDAAEAWLNTVQYEYRWSTILHRGTDRDYRLFNLPNPQNPETAPLVTLSTEVPVWLTALPRSRLLQEEIWAIPKTNPQDERVIVNESSIARSQAPGLAWRRHPYHPCVQALPLTQNVTPPNHFSPSRQLAPFELVLTSRKILLKPDGTQAVVLAGPDKWYFKSVETASAAADWPKIDELTATKPWSILPLLPMVPLGIPGTILPAAARGIEDPSEFLAGLQYRIDLPYLDEPNALAELPSDPSPAQQPPPPPPALLRNDYAAHWQHLNDRALLAAVDAVESLLRDDDHTYVVNVVDPLRWKVDVTTKLDEYPGEMIFKDAVNNVELKLTGEAAETDALRGFDGGFTATVDELRLTDVETDPTKWTDQPVRLVGGSFTATVETDGGSFLRDQRGLLRGGSTPLSGDAAAPLRTPLRLKRLDPQTETPRTDSVELFTLRKPVDLTAGSVAWRLWFKALPMNAANGGFKFQRSQCVSRPNGVNDVGAMDREHGHLTAYEWVLAEGVDGDKPFLDLGGFHFYPLELESAELDAGGAVRSLRVLGRLQLVLLDTGTANPTAWLDRELPNLDSAVFLEFDNGSLRRIRLASPDADGATLGPAQSHCWPAADPTLKPETPAILWNQIEYDATAGAERIVIKDWRIEYSRHGLSWTLLPAVDPNGAGGERKSLFVPLAGTSKVEFSDFDLATVRRPSNQPERESVQITKVMLTLFDGHRHDLDVEWEFHCGDKAKLRFQAALTDRLLRHPDDAPGGRTAQLIHLTSVVNLTVAWNLSARDIIDRRALQVVWTGAEANVSDLYLLPGFRLATSAGALSGFAIFNFELIAAPRGDGNPTAVEPTLRGSYADALFQCRWGTSLPSYAWDWGTTLPPEARLKASKALFESSAGDLTAEYTIRFTGAEQADVWASKLILTGLVEIKNLISWPNDLAVDAKMQITVPAAQQALGAGGLGHWRHTMRLVLSDHELPGDLLQGGSTACFLTVRSGQAWTFAAVCEHQLISVDVVRRSLDDKHGPPDDATLRLEADKALRERRWTCAQQVRLCSPHAVYDHLSIMGARQTFDSDDDSDRWPNGTFNSLLRGWYGNAFCQALGVKPAANSQEQDFQASEFGTALGEAMLFEASAAVFIRRSAANTRPGTDVAQLTEGVIRGGLADLADYQADATIPDADDKQFLFALVPFLGRSQIEESWDGGPLRTDPVLTIAAGGGAKRELALMFAQWGDADAVDLSTTPLDTSNQLWFRRLNSSSLREAWHRINVTRAVNAQTPASASSQGSLEPAGMLTAGASDSASLLARGASLGPLFDARRMSLPPSDLPQPPRDAAFNSLVWSRGSLQTLRATIERRTNGTQSFPFLAYPLILQGSMILGGKEFVRRHPAATLLPLPRDMIRVPILNADGTPVLDDSGKPVFSKGRETLEPVGLVLSPVVSIDAVGFGNDAAPKPLMAVGELVGFDPLGHRAVIIDSQLSNAEEGRTNFADGFKKWGTVVCAQMAADSGVAVVRLRTLLAVTAADAALIGLVRRFEFVSVDISPDGRDLVVRAFPLRTAPPQFRVHEGQFRGTRLPLPVVEGTLPDYALAPPLVDGVQPVRLNGRVVAPPDGVRPWPWGFAGLRMSTAYRRDGSSPLGVAGPHLNGTTDAVLWWQSFVQSVQFSNPADRQLLPVLFRAPALPGFLPAWPHTPLPPSYALHDLIRGWQSILPGGRHVLITGSRPGAPFAFRELVTTQMLGKPASSEEPFVTDADHVVQSASVPIQHRPPRPVLIPTSQKDEQTIALRTWGHWFDLDEVATLSRTVSVENQPHDDAFLMRPGPAFLPTGGLRLMLVRPTEEQLTAAGVTSGDMPALQAELAQMFGGPVAIDGEVNIDWDGTVIGSRQLLGAADLDWKLEATLTVGDLTVPLGELAPDATTFPKANSLWSTLNAKCLFRFAPSATDLVKISNSLAAAPQGMPIRVAITALLDDAAHPVYQLKGYKQALAFLLRFRRFDAAHETPRGGGDRRIFSPRFLKFEDPEYNRRLSSVPAKASRNVALNPTTRATITLAADRTEYNPGAKVLVVYTRGLPPLPDGTAPLPAGPEGSTGKIGVIRIRDGSPIEFATKTAIEVNKLATLDLAAIGGGEIRANDNLILRLTLDAPVEAGQDIDLIAAVVARPVTPVPEAAYAILKTTDGGNARRRVECIRFAWAPDPGRIELVCPDDLLADVVRRRAVFQCEDTVRNVDQTFTQYDVQKITSLGSTHFPVAPTKP